MSKRESESERGERKKKRGKEEPINVEKRE